MSSDSLLQVEANALLRMAKIKVDNDFIRLFFEKIFYSMSHTG